VAHNNYADQESWTPAEVADLFQVDPKTISRWADAGKFPGVFKTLGGHRRFPTKKVMKAYKKYIGGTGWS
jgi:excisionase family DNA binding protein